MKKMRIPGKLISRILLLAAGLAVFGFLVMMEVIPGHGGLMKSTGVCGSDGKCRSK